MGEHSIQVGAGAGFTGDRIEPAAELASRPDLDYLVFECMAELTIARQAAANGQTFDPLLKDRMRAVLPDCWENDTTIVTNMGGVEPSEAAEAVLEVAEECGFEGLSVASVGGSDVTDAIDELQPMDETDEWIDDPDDAIAAAAYLGTDGIVEALETGADVVVTGRVTDTALFFAPMVHAFGWQVEPLDRPDLVGQGLAAAHLLECAGQLTGGYYADPGYKDVDGLDRLGFPYAEVSEDGTVVLSKPDGTGGELTEQTCTEQLLYEIHDPTAYLTADGVVDFTGVELRERGEDVVELDGAVAEPRPETLKVTVAYEGPFVGEGAISYAGPGARDRAQLAGDVLRRRIERSDAEPAELRIDLVGVDALHGDLGHERTESPPYEVRTRVAGTFESRGEASRIPREVLALLTNGPAGGGGERLNVERRTGIVSALIDRAAVTPVVETVEV